MPGQTEAMVLAGVSRVLAGEDSTEVVASILRANPTLTREERGVVARRVIGISVWRRGLVHEAQSEQPERLLQAYCTLVEEERPPSRPWPDDPVARLGVRTSVPDWLARLWLDELGEEFALSLGMAMNRPGPVTIRNNRVMGSREDLRRDLSVMGLATLETPRSPEGLTFTERVNVFGNPLWKAGRFEVQDEGSQLIGLLAAALLPPQSKGLDFCAGWGGKTLALASLKPDARIMVHDVEAARLKGLMARARRAGAKNVLLLGDELADADLVLVDAPCSSLGTLRRSPDLRWRLRPEDLAAFAQQQVRILHDASRQVRSNGLLMYVTCTLLRAENEGVVAAFLEANPDFSRHQPASMDAPWPDLLRDGHMVLWPHAHGTDGFFAAILRRT